jgi:hypothetical protein
VEKEKTKLQNQVDDLFPKYETLKENHEDLKHSKEKLELELTHLNEIHAMALRSKDEMLEMKQ